MRQIISILYWAALALTCVPLFFIALAIYLVTLPFDPRGRVLHLYTCAWAQLYFRSNPFWRLRIEGRQSLPWHGPAMLVANHESLADILVLFGLFSPFKWVSKKSVFSVPFVGWNMRLNRYVGLVRGNKESILKMLAECDHWLKLGVPILMFPEGTRSSDGMVKAFKDGAFSLAIKHEVPVIPIALSGTARTLPKHGWVIKESARCRVRVLTPVDPRPFGGDVAALREHVRDLIIREKELMEGSVD